VTDDRLQRALAGRYDVREVIGRGGMGTVYVARDPRHNRDVAIKVLDTSEAASDARARFLREIRVTAGLTHPGIVPVFDSGDAEGLLYYVMPVLRGETLRQRMSRAALSPAEASSLIADVADALDLAHRHGIVHRDVKPENILFVEGRPVLTDFGVAYVAEAETKTQTGAMVGTLLYMSPEQLDSRSAVDARADVYALGCILYELLYGKPPHAADTVPRFLVQRASQAVTIPTDRPTPPGIQSVLRRALERDPENRFPSAAAFATALREARVVPIATTDRRALRWTTGAIVTIALLATGALFARRIGAPGADSISIAVLPFTNASPDRTLDYVGDGVSDELLAAIADISGVSALSRAAIDAARGSETDPLAVARKAGVAFVLTGTVRENGDAIRVSARLLDGRSGKERWSRALDGTLKDLFQMEEVIAQAVANELRVRVAPGRETIVRARTTRPEVHGLVLRAIHLQQAGGDRDNRRILALIDSAISLDSAFARAWSLRAQALLELNLFRDTTGSDILREARNSAVRAALLDSLSAEAQSTLAEQLFWYDWDWGASERHHRRAIALNPALAIAHSRYSIFLRALARFDDAREQHRIAASLDPTVSQAAGDFRISYFSRDYEKAWRELQSSTHADSTGRDWPMWCARIALARRQYDVAETYLNTYTRPEPWRNPLRVILYARTGRIDLARRLADSLGTSDAVGGVVAAFAAIEERTRALDVLDRGISTHGTGIVWLKTEPLFDPLRNEPRFQAVMRQLRFP
jgi:eukaryotic-like serine/threonine-protein kinase